MKKTFVFKLHWLILWCYLFAIGLPSLVYADNDTEQQIKLSFIYNFAKFVTWPNVINTTSNPFVICVIGSQPLAANLALLQGKKVNLRPIQVRFLNQDTQPRDCNMLFVSESEISRLEKFLLPIAAFPILTVSTLPNFVQAGGMIGLKELNDRVRFDVNLVATQKAGLSVNSQLSNLADEVVQ